MKKLYLVTILAITASLLSSLSIYAQQDSAKGKSPLSINCDLMSRYVWRGTDFGKTPSIQPKIEYSNNGLTVGAWGAFATTTSAEQETDLYVGYTFLNDMLSVNLTDYFVVADFDSVNYFEYDKNKTSHIFELSASFNGTESLPLSVLIATNLYGNDARRYDANGKYKIQYSTYAEFSYKFNHFDVFMGLNLTDPKDEIGYYGDNYGVVNLGITASKDMKITNKFSVPLTVSLITNPQAEKIYFVAGISF